MADLFGILKNKALLMTLSKSDIMELINELNTAIETGDSTVVDLAKSYIDQQIAALPAGGLYQPISEFKSTLSTTDTYADFYDYIDPDADLVIVKLILSGNLTWGSQMMFPKFSFGWSTGIPDTLLTCGEVQSGATFNITAASPWPLYEWMYRRVGRFGINSNGTISKNTALFCGDDELPIDAEGVERRLYMWYQASGSSTWSRAAASQISACNLNWDVTVRNYSLEG